MAIIFRCRTVRWSKLRRTPKSISKTTLSTGKWLYPFSCAHCNICAIHQAFCHQWMITNNRNTNNEMYLDRKMKAPTNMKHVPVQLKKSTQIAVGRKWSGTVPIFEFPLLMKSAVVKYFLNKIKSWSRDIFLPSLWSKFIFFRQNN